MLTASRIGQDVEVNFPARVAIVSPGLPPPPGGLQQLGLDAHVGLSALTQVETVGAAEAPLAVPGVATVALGRAAPVTLAAAAIRMVRRTKPDVLLSITWKVALPTQPFHRGLSTIYAHGAELVRHEGALGRLRKRALDTSDLVIANSHYTADIVTNETATPVTVVSPGIELPSAISDRPRRDGAFRVISVGALVPRKGHARLVDAVVKARADGTDLRLVIVGDGPERNALSARIAALGAADVITLAGRVTDTERDALYRDADAFALLGQRIGGEFEGFGIVLLEAASYGLPVITTTTGGTADAITSDNAIVVTGVDDAADALRSLAEDAARCDAMAAAGVRYAAECTVARRAEEFLAAFRDAAERK